MGGATAPKATLTDPPRPRFGAVTTPRPEVELTCRLSLAHYLAGRMPEAAETVIALLEPERPGIRVPDDAAERDRLRALSGILPDLRIVDPACGQGAFLAGMLDVLCDVSARILARLGGREDQQTRRARFSRRLYGVEVDPSAAETARRRLSEGGGRPQIAQGDSLVERPLFRWSERFAEVAERGGFDLIIGNPPYVRHERITDPLAELSPHAYKLQAATSLQSRLTAALPAHCGASPGNALSRRADLAALFTLLAFTLLRPAGVLGFVLPIASFDAQYGAALRDVLCHSGRRARLLQSGRRRSFAQVAVNTGIFIVRPRCHADLPATSAPAVEHISIGDSLAPMDLGTAMWGGKAAVSPADHLRRRLAGHVTTIGAVGAIRYALKTGINRFFFPDAGTVDRFGIEPEYLIPALKSPRDVRTINLSTTGIPARLFRCDYAPEELARRGSYGALAYIHWGEQQVSADGVGWPLVSSLRGRQPWYALPRPQYGDILCPRFFDRRFFFVRPTVPLPADQTFYDLILRPDLRDQATLCAALLNCSLSYLWVETHGRTGLGGGVRQYALCDTASLPALDPRRIAATFAPAVVAAFSRLAARPILPVEDEMQQPDRAVLDTAVAAAVGMTATEMPSVRQLLVELVSRRRERARSV